MKKEKDKKERAPLEQRLLQAYNVNTVKALAVKLETAYTTVIDWGKGKNEIPNDILLRVNRETGASISWILTGEEEARTENISKPELELLAALKQRGDVTEETKNQILSILDLLHPPKKNKA